MAVPWRTSFFHHVNEFSFIKNISLAPLDFVDSLRALAMCVFCPIRSQNNTSLMLLNLEFNQIGDTGASGIGAGLAYVLLVIKTFLFDERTTLWRPLIFVLDNGHYQDVFVSDLQPKQDVADVVALQQSDSCRGRSCAQTCTPGICFVTNSLACFNFSCAHHAIFFCTS